MKSFLAVFLIIFFVFSCDDTSSTNNTNNTNSDAGSDAADSDVIEDSGVVDNPYCVSINEPTRPFITDGTGSGLYSVASDITIPTTEGNLRLSEIWTGCDSILFIPENPSQNGDFPGMTWSRDIASLLDNSPENVHMFFISDTADETARTESLTALKALFDAEFDDMPIPHANHWRERVHFVTVRARDAEGFLGDHFPSPGFGLGIDRFQRMRYIGSFADPSRYNESVGWFEPNLSFVRNESIYYNFESKREEELDLNTWETLPLISENPVAGDHFFTVDFPSAAEMDLYDTMIFDMTMRCENGGEVGSCPEWDRLVHLYLCTDSTDESCNLEIGRWITSYHRHGRWVHDVSPLIGLFANGGNFRFKYYSQDPWIVTLSAKLTNKNKTRRVSSVHPLWSGYFEFNETYNDNFPAVDVSIPDNYGSVELASVITGHGMSNPGNCAEFCNTEHTFSINDGDVVRSFTEAGRMVDCMWKTEEGTVPNQYGTWWYGRSGWCPGKEVQLVTEDITTHVSGPGVNQVSYTGFYNDQPYTGDNWRGIMITAFVVVYTE